MGRITSDTILAKLREVSEDKKESQFREICSIAQTAAFNVEAIVELIALSGELHIDLLNRKHIDAIIEPHYEGNMRCYSRISRTSSIHTGMTHLAGNAHIYTNDAGEESVGIVCVLKFKRDFLQSSLLPEVRSHFMKAIQTRIDTHDSIVFHSHPDSEWGPVRDMPGWHVTSEVRDDSIIVTLKFK